ncbi:MFS transporter [Sphaerisporangium rufum]|uniref:MFS transporter n=1 Tax=Sphaerisporangium rufum TaxID=1381558 RepID=A0A919V0V9_9ACTN|nr:MFS transporter [Sphaerisporangium rufum]GII77173.1 MFS transporter [Sphaerisporangium rufum]
MTTTPAIAAPRAGRREWAGLAVLSLPALLASLELTVTHLALPAIAADLRAGGAQPLWIVDIYAFLLAGSLTVMGALGDRIGRRRLLLGGAAVYGAASVLAAYATSAGMLIAVRALLGVAGATLMPSVLALTVTMFRDGRQRAVAVSVVIACVSGGTAIGPPVGGWLLERFWWGSAFLLAVPVMALLLAAGPFLLPAGREATARRLDPVGAVLSLAAVLPVVYGLKQVAAAGAGLPALLPMAAGAAFAVVFARRQLRVADPLLDLRLFTGRAFGTAAATLALGIFVLWGANYAIAQYLQLVRGLAPLAAGLWTAPSAAGVIAGSLLGTRIARRFGHGRVIGAGLALAAAGFTVLTQAGTGGGLAALVTGSIVVSAGLGPMMALATDMIVAVAPPERAGAASAVSSMAPQLGGALGIAVLGSVMTAVYRGEMAAAVPPGLLPGLPAAARDTLGGAVAVAGTLPGPAAAELLGAARAAFVAGFHLSVAASAVLMAVLAVLVVTLLRGVRTPG